MNRSALVVARRIVTVMDKQERVVIHIPREEFKQLAGRSTLRKSYEQEVLGQLAELGYIAVFGDSVVVVSYDELSVDLQLDPGSLQFRPRRNKRRRVRNQTPKVDLTGTCDS